MSDGRATVGVEAAIVGKKRSKLRVESVASEFLDVGVEDPRLATRLMRLADLCSKAPDWSFPDQMQSTADLEAFYRFASNAHVDDAAIARAHFQKTAERISEHELVLVPCDTTEFNFTGRKNMGYLQEGREGFLLHAALAICPGKARLPLGVIEAHVWKRAKKRTGKPGTVEYHKTKESRRWAESVERIATIVKNPGRLIFIADREADAFEYLVHMHGRGRRHVTRMGRDRLIEDDADEAKPRMSHALTRVPDEFSVEVTVSARKGDVRPHANHPPRDRRIARVAVAATTVTIKKPRHTPLHRVDGRASLDVNVVRVHELNPPEGQQPIEWILSTSEPIGTADELQRIVEYYRARWVIEEFFRALKSGCRYEARQLETYETLTRALMIFLPIAWRLILFRSAARDSPNDPASSVLAQHHIDVLKAHFGLPPELTVEDALRGVARLGGHIKQNGPPGWIVLGRGFVKLDQMATGWALARAETHAQL
jgi:Transposase DNA-binding/Transposase DDE domain